MARYISQIDGDGLAEAKRRRELVLEDHGGYVVTADIEDEPPQHNHFDDRDAPWDMDECPACRWLVNRAEGQ